MPLLWLSAAFLIGILLRDWLNLPLEAWLTAAVGKLPPGVQPLESLAGEDRPAARQRHPAGAGAWSGALCPAADQLR
jgi:hypothetical protein